MLVGVRVVGGGPASKRGRVPLLVVAAMAATLLPACGLRVSHETVKAATAAATSGGGGVGPGGSGGGVSQSDTSSGNAVGSDLSAQQTADNGANGSTATTLLADAGGGPQLGSSTPAGGNGGATDVGVTATQITVGNVSDLGGPVPGLFQGGPYGTRAYFDYINSQGGVYGRKLELTTADDGLQCTQNQADYQDLIPKVFGFVGSWSLDDDCGAHVLAQHPDVPVLNQALSPEAAALKGYYSEAPFGAGAPSGFFEYYKAKYPDAITKVGTIVGNQPSAVRNWQYSKHAMESLGYKIIYEDDFPPAQSNFTADVVRMREAGVKMVYVIAVNAPDLAAFAKEANQQGWKPEVWASGIGYFSTYVDDSGGAQSVEGQYVNASAARFLGEDAATVPEVALFDNWIKKAFPTFPIDQFAAFSWAEAALFVKALQAIGPNVTRKALLAALANIHDYNDNGLMAPVDVGSRQAGHCYVLLQLHNGKYDRVDDPGSGYRCDGHYIAYHG